MDNELIFRRKFWLLHRRGRGSSRRYFFTGWSGIGRVLNSSKHSSIIKGGTVGLGSIAEGFQLAVALESPLAEHLYIADRSGKYIYT